KKESLRIVDDSAAIEEKESDPEEMPEEILGQLQREQLLRDSIASLPPRCQEMVHLLFFEDPPRPYNEVAEQLGLATGSIGFIRGRCLKRLRAQLEKGGLR